MIIASKSKSIRNSPNFLPTHALEDEIIFTKEDVAEVAESLHTHKAAGPDEIDPEHLM